MFSRPEDFFIFFKRMNLAYEAARRERLKFFEGEIKHWKKLARRFQYYLDCYVDIFLTDDYVLRRLNESAQFLEYYENQLDGWDGPRVDQMRADLQKEQEKCMNRIHHIHAVMEALRQYRFNIPY